MNQEQIKSGARWFIATFGGLIAGWFAAKGWFTVDQVTSVLNSPTLLSIVGTIGALVWGMFTHTQTSAVGVVDAIAKQKDSPVKALVMEATPAGKELAEALPGSTSVVAGTQAAVAVAHAA